MPRLAPPLVALLVAAAFLAPTHVRAQEGPGGAGIPHFEPISRPDYEDPSDIDRDFRFFRCLSVSEGLRPNCMSDLTEEDFTREEVRRLDRWTRSGVLFVGQLMAGAEFVRDIYHAGSDLVDTFQSIVAGVNLSQPEHTVMALRRATMRFDRSIDRAGTAAKDAPEAMVERRYEHIHTAAMHALVQARDGHESAASLSQQAVQMHRRLGHDGDIEVITVGGGTITTPRAPLPPMASDAPPGAGAIYEDLASIPAGAGTTDPVRVNAELARLASGGPMGAAADGAASTCALIETDDSVMDPQVMFARVAEMAKGAQAAGSERGVDLKASRETLRALGNQEMDFADQIKTLNTFRMLARF